MLTRANSKRSAKGGPPGKSGRRLNLSNVAPASAPPPKEQKKSWRLVVGPGSIASMVFLLVLLAGWGVLMTGILLFGDRLSVRLIAQNSEMQDAYEQRLQAYRDEIARVVSEMERSHFDQDSVEGRVVELGRRQRAIEARINALNKLADLVAPGARGPGAPADPSTQSGGGTVSVGGTTLPLPPSRTPTPTLQAPGPAPKPSQAAPSGKPAGSGSRTWLMEPNSLIHLAQAGAAPEIEQAPSQSQVDLEAQIARVEVNITRSEASVTKALDTMARLSDQSIDRFRQALDILGLTPEELAPANARQASEIPNIVLPLADQTGPFAAKINQIRGNFGLSYRIRFALEALPISKPAAYEVRFSSPFGYRIHPIFGTRKLHAGLDMAAPVGTVVHAAGSGVVLSAGWGGGYGNLVQIEHGNGIVSRYAHMSQIDVVAGQPVSAGTVLGLSGSTGNSTGPHLHFETRLKSVPTNPACFLWAGDKLYNRVEPGLPPCDKKPFGGKDSDSSEEEDDDS